jgi:hypothetical protein
VEILSPPAVIVETVTDLDVGFPSGVVKSFTIYAVDVCRKTHEGIEIETMVPPETITLYREHICWVSRRTRTITRPVKPTAAT